MYKDIFKRYEIKYLLSAEQYRGIIKEVCDKIEMDQYGRSVICNIYFDTPDFRLIRNSIEKPIYKEKLRLRTYGVPTTNSTAFVELKKKYDGIVYKRRVSMLYGEAHDYLINGMKPPQPCQITHEIDWFNSFYRNICPEMVITYDRIAYFAKENPDIRFTFDSDLRWRTDNLDLRSGTDGDLILEDSQALMELKIPDAMPLWLADALDKVHAFPSSFSKYGTAYQKMFRSEFSKKGDFINV